MSSFTTQIRYICESLAGYDASKGYMSVDDIIDKSWNKIFPPSFETFTPEYKAVLAKKILKHYYTREIGSETFGLFQLRLDAKLSVIMPYYNKLYKAFEKDYDILSDTDVTIDHNRKSNGGNKNNTSSEGTANTTGQTISRHSNTPQGGLDGIMSDRYLSSADIADTKGNDKNKTSVISNGTFNTTEDYVQHITGKRGGMTYAYMVNEYAEKLKNIDRMVISELSDLFMQVWDWGCFDGEE